MNILLLYFTFTFFICLALIAISMKFKHILDLRHQNIQKIHIDFIPRLGGLSFISFFTLFFLEDIFQINENFIFFFVIFFIVLLGFIEDISESLNSKLRAILSSLIIIIFIINTDFRITSVDINFIDHILSNKYFSIIFLFICIFISIHSFNLIDGMNGLCSGYFLVCLIVLYLVFKNYSFVNYEIICLVLIGCVLGFFVLNFPLPKIFLGDSGSYFLGFVLAVLSVIATTQSTDISPWFFALLYVYPVTEFAFSILRRLFLKNSPFQSDFNHLHSLIFTFLKNKKYFSNETINNSLSTLIILNLFSYQIFFSLLFINNTKILMFFCILSIFIYFLFYFLLNSFKKIK
jgi:UDP-GlcNAc:undecaprenyl-phosphate/decaprenyl-phosphate GlcNAc-1-phosphate transferase